MSSSYIMYFAVALISAILAELAQRYSKVNKNGKRIPNYYFWAMSCCILIFIMGFRLLSVGVDDISYLSGYNIANSMSVKQYYQIKTTEPGFYLIYRLVYLIFDDFQWLIIITSAITVILFYKAFSYEIENVSLFWVVLIFSFTQYFYYFGIVRMGISVAIISVAYRYIIENNKKKYILMVVLATMFHYSALFALVALFINTNRNNNFKRSTIFKLAVIVPLGFTFVRFFIYPLVNDSRYQEYIDVSEKFSFGFITSIPFLILFIVYYSSIRKNKHYQFYFLLYIVKIVTEMFSPLIGIGRMVWYVNISICLLLPAIIRIVKDKIIKVVLMLLICVYCIFYSNNSYFGDSYRGEFMIPYRNVYFELNS